MPASNQKRIEDVGIALSASWAETVADSEDDTQLAITIMGLACNMDLSKPKAVPNDQPSLAYNLSEPTFSPPPPHLWFEAHSQFSRQAASYLWYGPTPDWWSINRVGQKSFIDFARRDPAYLNDDSHVLPATNRAVIEWIAHLGAQKMPTGTLKSYLIDVRALHIDAGYSTAVFESPVVQSLIRGIKRVHQGRPEYPKLPITIDVLRQLCAATSDDPQHNAGLKAALTVAFSAFLCLSEFTVPTDAPYDPAIHLSRGCVRFFPHLSCPTHISLSLPASKTDPFRKGATILLAAAPGAPTCPVAALKAVFEDDPRPPSAPLFSGGAPGHPLNRMFFILSCCVILYKQGIDTRKLSGFSFRRGAAVAADAVGYSQDEIRLLGRWRSDADRLYREVSRDRILQLSARLHWTETTT